MTTRELFDFLRGFVEVAGVDIPVVILHPDSGLPYGEAKIVMSDDHSALFIGVEDTTQP